MAENKIAVDKRMVARVEESKFYGVLLKDLSREELLMVIGNLEKERDRIAQAEKSILKFFSSLSAY